MVNLLQLTTLLELEAFRGLLVFPRLYVGAGWGGATGGMVFGAYRIGIQAHR